MQILRVFISSTMEDLQEERVALAKGIDKKRFWQAIYAESFVARSQSPREVCLEEVRRSHIYIGMFKTKYGYIPRDSNAPGLSVVHLEYLEAKKNRLPPLIFVCKNSLGREPKLEEFLQEITDFDKGHWKKDYSTVEELVSLAVDALDHEVVERAVESIETERRKSAEDAYSLPYFERLKGRFEE